MIYLSAMTNSSTPSFNRKVFGIVGGAGVGKGVITDMLQEEGYYPISLSDILRKVADRVGVTHGRESLNEIGNFLRGKFGQDILAALAVDLIEEHPEIDKFVVESIRHPSEVQRLQRDVGAYVMGVTMPEEMRFELLRARKRPGDPTTKKGFNRLVHRVEAGLYRNGINIPEALKAADIVLHNDSTLDDFRKNAREILVTNGFLPEGAQRASEGESQAAAKEGSISLPMQARR